MVGANNQPPSARCTRSAPAGLLSTACADPVLSAAERQGSAAGQGQWGQRASRRWAGQRRWPVGTAAAQQNDGPELGVDVLAPAPEALDARLALRPCGSLSVERRSG
eukprot:15483143-Alexandrium_andersonii.AAC.1